jgi:hypothetical protein
MFLMRSAQQKQPDVAPDAAMCPALPVPAVAPACTLSTYQEADAPFPDFLWSSHFGRVGSASCTQSGPA